MDYQPNLKDLPNNLLPTLYESPRMRKVFSDDKVQIRTGFRRTKNLKDLLVPSSLPVADQENSINSGIIGCYTCHQQVCDTCQNFLVPAKRIKSVTTGNSYKIKPGSHITVKLPAVPVVVPGALPGTCPSQIFLMGTLVPGTADSLPAVPGELS